MSRCVEEVGAVSCIPRPLSVSSRVEADLPQLGSKHGLKRQNSKTAVEESSREHLRARVDTERPTPARSASLPLVATPQSRTLREIEAIVVNLERRPDRMAGCAARLEAYCPWLRFLRFDACDGRRTVMKETEVATSWHTGRNVVYQRQRAIRKGWDDLDSYKVRELVLSPGERGCAVSHIRAWEHCLERAGDTDRPLLVLEDDAAPTPEFTATLKRAMAATPLDAHILYLGYSQAAEWRREITADVVEAEYVWTTVGYIVWPAGARILLSRLPVDQPVDNWMATLAADNEIKAYCVRPKIIRQAEAWNVNSDVAHSDEHYWGPCSDIHHSDDFYWGNPTSASSTTAAPDFGNPASASSNRFLQSSSVFWDIDSEDSEGMSDEDQTREEF